MSPYGLPDPLAPSSQAEDPLATLDAYFNRTSKAPYEAPSLAPYASSRATSPAYRATNPVGQAPYAPPGPPIRFQFDALGDWTQKALDSPVGVAAGLGAPSQRGGSVDFMGANIATAPINAQNFATYAREGQLSAIASFLGHHYQQPEGMNAQPKGQGSTDNILTNIGQGDFPGVVDNLIAGMGAAGDAINAPFAAARNWVANEAARDRAKGVVQLLSTGEASYSIV